MLESCSLPEYNANLEELRATWKGTKVTSELKMLQNLKKAAKDLREYICNYISDELKVSLTDMSDKELKRYLRAPLGRSQPTREFMNQLPFIVQSDAYLLIQGDTGTGKGTLAELIALASGKRRDRFQRLNLTGYPPDLAWAHVIGHTADAFTGPILGKLGSYCLAHEGTLFIDEFEHVDPLVQVLFLDITQRTRKHLRRIGSNRELMDEIKDKNFIEKDLGLSKNSMAWLREIVKGILAADRPIVRLIFGITSDLKQEVERGKFREDLYHRVNILKVCLPRLEERRDDFAGLVGSAVDDFDRDGKVKGFCPRFYDALCKRKWPGNMRQLRNTIQAATAYARDGIIRYSEWLEHTLENLNQQNTKRVQMVPTEAPAFRNLPKKKTYPLIAKVLNETICDRYPKGNFRAASRILWEQGICSVSDTTIRNIVNVGGLNFKSKQYFYKKD